MRIPVYLLLSFRWRRAMLIGTNGVSMSLRRVALALASVTLSVILIALLIRVGKIDLRVTLYQLRAVRAIILVKLILLYSLLIYLSTEKWRSIDAALRQASDFAPSRVTSFAVTGAGMALGLVIPVQLGMTTARTLGMSIYGNTLRRGTAATLFEQGFDLLTVVLLTAASATTWFCGGGGLMWTISAAAMTALALLAAAPSIRLIRWLASFAARAEGQQFAPRTILRRFSKLQHSGVLSAALARRLAMLSIVRFAVVVLIAGQTAEAISAPIPLWRLAAAIPFVVLACVIAITPGGLGVNELTSAAALEIFGTPFSIGARWAIANRVLGVAACFVAAALAASLLGIKTLGAAVQRARPAKHL
jgi:hypothetical protein